MLPDAQRFDKWLRRRSPHATTPVHYLNDLKLFFAWAGKPPTAITLHDVDDYIDHCRQLGHAVATINRRLAAIRTFYHFLQTESDDVPPNPALPRRHLISDQCLSHVSRLEPYRESGSNYFGESKKLSSIHRLTHLLEKWGLRSPLDLTAAAQKVFSEQPRYSLSTALSISWIKKGS